MMDSQEEEKRIYATKQEVLDRVKELAQEENPSKQEIDHLKVAFYHLLNTEREAQQKAYIEAGGDPMQYVVPTDEDEQVFKAEMSIIREKRQKAFLAQEEEKQNNLKRKLEIIERIKTLATSPEEANNAYQEFKALQNEWKEIKAVPAENATDLWKTYQLCVEQFYDLLKLNSEAREYDFKKNYEMKTALCETAERLAEEEDVISAFHQLQELHSQYREIGPVAKELRDEIWNRFKQASTVVNRRHAAHFEAIRSQEEINLTKKEELCEKVEAIANAAAKSSAEWEEKTKEVIALQAEWKTIGFAPQKMNVKIFERFRSACDAFFNAKNLYFKELKEKFSENIAKKQALVEQAQALADSTDWKATSDKLIQLQKDWKTIGMVPKKLGDELWNNFLNACNKFFEARNAAGAGQRNEEHENLEKKKGIIEQLKTLIESEEEGIQQKMQALTSEYNGIGHVPFREKDSLFREYHDTLDTLYKKLNASSARRRLDKFKSNLKDAAQRGENAVNDERTRLQRRFETLKQELQTYENNLTFLSATSKKGNSLIDEMNRKMQKLRDDLDLVKAKIKAINEAE
ncbi:MAG: DUF349 domain-containing protein [Prevotella sp.]|nr:DUF349 domain-containing protein [Prevotella sp.]